MLVKVFQFWKLCASLNAKLKKKKNIRVHEWSDRASNIVLAIFENLFGSKWLQGVNLVYTYIEIKYLHVIQFYAELFEHVSFIVKLEFVL